MRNGFVDRRGLIVSKGWIQASLLVMLSGFGVMGVLAYGANDGGATCPVCSTGETERSMANGNLLLMPNSPGC